MQLNGLRVLVLGLGESGLAMAKWLARQGARVRVADTRQNPPNVAALRATVADVELFTGTFSAAAFADVALIAISPGISPSIPLIQDALALGVSLVSEIELFAFGARQLTPHAKIIAITGSNGKTTTTALTAHLLNASGFAALACGNISPSALDALMRVEDGDKSVPSADALAAWVLELSSFQLERTFSLYADAACVLNISEDHLDRYADLAAYAAAKARVLSLAKACVFNRDDTWNNDLFSAWLTNGAWLAGAPLTFGTTASALNKANDGIQYGVQNGYLMRGNESLIALDALPIRGLHNAANVLAALALCECAGFSYKALIPALSTFKGLAHRVALVSSINGVAYIDDSKGTNVGASLAALQGMGCKVAIILGGEGKGQDFSPLKAALSQHGRAVALIGRDAQKIADAIEGCQLPIHFCADLPTAVRWCAVQAQAGDALLLSPACASFDMFRHYVHRAEVFIDTVRSLEQEGA